MPAIVCMLMAYWFFHVMMVLFATTLMSVSPATPSIDDSTYDKLRITSYNCHGCSDTRAPYMRILLQQCEFLFIQEHWLADNQLYTLSSICDTHISHGFSEFDNDDIIRGRPYGGCAILWRADLKSRVYFVHTNNKRICSIRVCTDAYKLLLINVRV
jgi:hypothetical protein